MADATRSKNKINDEIVIGTNDGISEEVKKYLKSLIEPLVTNKSLNEVLQKFEENILKYCFIYCIYLIIFNCFLISYYVILILTYRFFTYGLTLIIFVYLSNTYV